MFVDLHGHSRKQNVFMYGCAPERGGGLLQKVFSLAALPATLHAACRPSAFSSAARSSQPATLRTQPATLLTQVFPLLLSRVERTFDFASCNYSIKKSKEGTGRVVVHRELSLETSYTLEASFAGSSLEVPGAALAAVAAGEAPVGAEAEAAAAAPTAAPASSKPPQFHYTPSSLKQIGASFCNALLHFFGLPPSPPELLTIASTLPLHPDHARAHAPRRVTVEAAAAAATMDAADMDATAVGVAAASPRVQNDDQSMTSYYTSPAAPQSSAAVQAALQELLTGGLNDLGCDDDGSDNDPSGDEGPRGAPTKVVRRSRGRRGAGGGKSSRRALPSRSTSTANGGSSAAARDATPPATHAPASAPAAESAVQKAMMAVKHAHAGISDATAQQLMRSEVDGSARSTPPCLESGGGSTGQSSSMASMASMASSLSSSLVGLAPCGGGEASSGAPSAAPPPSSKPRRLPSAHRKNRRRAHGGASGAGSASGGASGGAGVPVTPLDLPGACSEGTKAKAGCKLRRCAPCSSAAAASPECARWSVRDGLAPPLPTSTPVWSGGALDSLSDGSLSDDGLVPQSSPRPSTETADAAGRAAGVGLPLRVPSPADPLPRAHPVPTPPPAREQPHGRSSPRPHAGAGAGNDLLVADLLTISPHSGRRHCRSLSSPSPRTGGAGGTGGTGGTPLAIFGGGAAGAATAAAIAEHAAVYSAESTTWDSLASSLEHASPPRLASHAAAAEHARPAASSRTDGSTSPACTLGASSSRAASFFSGAAQAPHGAAVCVVPQQPPGAATFHPASPRHLSLPHHERFALCGSALSPAVSPAAGRRGVPRPTGMDGTAVAGRGGAVYAPRVQRPAPAGSRGSADTMAMLDSSPAPPFACGVGPGTERPDRSLSVGSPRCTCQGGGAGGGGGGGGGAGGGGAVTERLDRSVSVGSPRCACQGGTAPTSRKLGVGLLVGAGLLDGLVEGLVPVGGGSIAVASGSIADGLVGRRYSRSRVPQRDPGLPCGSPITLRKMDTASRASTDSQ